MGLKENVEALKQELSAEEQFLESVIKAEGFFKRYKKVLIAAVAVLLLGIAAYLVTEYIKNRNIALANQALATLQQNPSDANALAQLKEKSPQLYMLFQYSQAVKSGDSTKMKALEAKVEDPILKDLLAFQSASAAADAQALDAYAGRQDAILQELATLDEAFLLFEQGKGDAARKVLERIPLMSPMHQIVQNFLHYQK